MPFTPTHIVAVLPLWPLRRWLPFEGLAIGAMVPDIVMFFPVANYAQTHSTVGVFSTCLPIGFAIFLLVDTVMRGPLVTLLPHWFQARMDPLPKLPTVPHLRPHLIFYAGLVVSIVIGAFTHQVWDAITHQGRWGTDLFPSLNSTFAFAGFALPGYKLFQYGSTLVGLPLLAIVTMVSLNRVEATHRTKSASAPARLCLMSLLSLVPFFIGVFAWTTQSNAYRALGVTIKLSGASLMTLCVAYCVSCQVRANGQHDA